MTNYLIDAGKVERIAVQYGESMPSEGRKDHAKERVLEETIGAVYPDEIPDNPRFFSGIPLVVALIQLHRTSENPTMLEHIEREIEVARGTKRAPITEFDLKPFPYASPPDLLACAERFEKYNRFTSRYFRLRAFQAAGAFIHSGLPHARGGEDAELTDEELDYLEAI